MPCHAQTCPPPFLLIPGDSLVHQAIRDFGPVLSEVLKVLKQGGDLLPDVSLQQEEEGLIRLLE